MFSGCTAATPCVITPIPLGRWPALHFADDVPDKAFAYPDGIDGTGAEPYICADRAIWNDHTPQGKIWTYLHELGHCEGAKCEPCADHRAGEVLQQSGWDAVPGDDGFLSAIAETLEHRDPAQAQEAFHRGYTGQGLDRPGLDASTLTQEEVTFYVPDGRGGTVDVPGTCVEIRTGIWVDILNADAWDALFSAASAAGIVWTANSSFRTMDQQIAQWDLRHPAAPWADNPSASAPSDPAIVQARGPAATPGFSEHQSGRAVDLSFAAPAQYDQFAALAEPFSIYRDAPTERWHFAWVDPLVYPNGRRKYPLGTGLASVTDANLAAGTRTAGDAADGTDLGTETNPTQPYLANAPAAQFPLALAVIVALVIWAWRSHAL